MLNTPEKKRNPFSDGNSIKSPGLSRELKSLMLSSPDSSRKKPGRRIFGEKNTHVSPSDSDKENQGIPGRPKKSPRKSNSSQKKQPVILDSNLELSFDEESDSENQSKKKVRGS